MQQLSNDCAAVLPLTDVNKWDPNFPPFPHSPLWNSSSVLLFTSYKSLLTRVSYSTYITAIWGGFEYFKPDEYRILLRDMESKTQDDIFCPEQS